MEILERYKDDIENFAGSLFISVLCFVILVSVFGS